MSISGIYQIQSKIKPQRIYIGSSVNIYKRLGEHVNILRLNKHHNPKLQSHYNKYGESDLQFSVLLGCNKEDLIKTEQYFLDFYKPYFNCCQIAGSTLGMIPSFNTRQKQSIAKKGKPSPRKGVPMSEEQKEKLRLFWRDKPFPSLRKGVKASDETREKLRKSHMGKKQSRETIAKRILKCKEKRGILRIA